MRIGRLMKAELLPAALVVLAAGASQGAIIVYGANLDGPSESPPNDSPGTGITTVTVDTVAHTMRVEASFDGLVAGTTASHIHAATTTPLTGTAGVATTTPTFSGFPLGVTSGVYDITLDMTQASSYNPAYVTAHGGTTAQAEMDLFQAIAEGRAYLNIHSSAFPGGEIRGFLVPVPTPGAMALLGLGGVAALRRRRS